MRVQIERQFTLLAKEKGRYHSFPTMVRHGNQLWLACRSGAVSGRQDHGHRGKVLLFSADVSDPCTWRSHGTLFSPSTAGTVNELDAILSAPETGLFFLATRDYAWQKRNNSYLSQGPSPVLTQRTMLANISDQCIICFSHIRKTAGNDLLMPGYCCFDDEPSGTPVLLVSSNRGKNWSLRSNVASSTAVGTRLTEYALGYLGGTDWTALIRNETPPFHLYRTESHDDGRSWSFPEKTDLLGHAPMILDVKASGGRLAIYRDLSEPDPGVAVGYSSDHSMAWKRVGRLASYTGSIYDGGYGDLLALDDNRYLAVYYLCDEEWSPWIDGCIFSIE